MDLNSRLALGCMRIGGKEVSDVERLIEKALELGINFFDHADIYGGGRSEQLFGDVLRSKPELRDKMIVQTKCSIVPGTMYDASKEHIISSVDGSLKRLGTDHVDVLLLHRPDALADYSEIAEAFDELEKSGKVLNFGVSNHSVMQMELIKKYVKQPLRYNQMQFSIVHCPSVDAGFHVNMRDDYASNRDGGSVFDYCYLNDITIQAWSVVQASWAEGTFLDNPSYGKLNDLLAELGSKYGVTKSAIAIAWILRMPSGIMPILGTTSCEHLAEMAKATGIKLTREEWYKIYLAVEKPLP